MAGSRSMWTAPASSTSGRDGLARQIARRSRAAPVVTVLRPSGVGKSSLVRAGVLLRLRAEPGTVVVPMRPSEARTPLRSLAFALDRALAPQRSTDTTAESELVRRPDRVTGLTGGRRRPGQRHHGCGPSAP
ncbi:nSTAND1 domain-containing NTPase [Streptomyces jumonjinensis]|uniref:nSTAND1 domain-containing NTPase n=1 Tax=Streptomyces jumonjinensis TaxID=1945 RepID=UPI00379C39A1